MDDAGSAEKFGSLGAGISTLSAMSRTMPDLFRHQDSRPANSLGIRAGDLVHAMLHTSVDLELGDTRHVQVSLRTLDGDFEVTGLIALASKGE